MRTLPKTTVCTCLGDRRTLSGPSYLQLYRGHRIYEPLAEEHTIEGSKESFDIWAAILAAIPALYPQQTLPPDIRAC